MSTTDTTGERLLTELDHARLTRLLLAHPHQRDLQELLDLTSVVPSRQVPGDTVTMNSEVEVLDRASGQCRRLTLCYPRDADPGQGRVSVLSPVGTSLVGRRVGEEARWLQPGGEVCRADVLRLVFQPEAIGDFTA